MHCYAEHRILVVDDEMVAAAPIAEIIRRRIGCSVDIASCGEEALVRLAEYPYDVMLTDMLMPGLHGVDLIRKTAAQYPLLRIVVMTAYANDFPYIDVIDAGAADFMMKPHTADELVAKMISQLRIAVMREESVQAVMHPAAATETIAEARTLQRASEARYRSLFEGSMNGMVLLESGSYRIVEANPAFCALANRDHDALLRQSFLDMIDANARARLESVIDTFQRRRQGALGDVCFTNENANAILDINLSFIEVGTEELILVMAKDVTEQQEMHRQLAAIATTDALTGLANRRAFDARLRALVHRSQEYGEPCTLLFIDIDNFKRCNDTHGHQAGDDLLRRMGRIVSEQIRLERDTGFRYGGDEFAVLLALADAETAERVAARIRQQFMAGDCHGTSLSMGIAQFALPMSADALVHAADEALYRAKSAGKDQVAVA